MRQVVYVMLHALPNIKQSPVRLGEGIDHVLGRDKYVMLRTVTVDFWFDKTTTVSEVKVLCLTHRWKSPDFPPSLLSQLLKPQELPM